MTDANFLVAADPHTHKSALRERIVEHAFVSKLLRALWSKRITDAEVLRSEFDAYGYDLVVERGKIVRHIQLKTKRVKPEQRNRRPSGTATIASSLQRKPSACVLWLGVDDNLSIISYFWFGSSPGDPLPDVDCFKISKRVTPTGAGKRPLRPNYREVPLSKFDRLNGFDEVLEKLLGPLS